MFAMASGPNPPKPPGCNLALRYYSPRRQVKALFPAEWRLTGGPHFTGMNLSPARRVFTPWRGTSAMAMATLFVTGTEVTVSTP